MNFVYGHLGLSPTSLYGVTVNGAQEISAAIGDVTLRLINTMFWIPLGGPGFQTDDVKTYTAVSPNAYALMTSGAPVQNIQPGIPASAGNNPIVIDAEVLEMSPVGKAPEAVTVMVTRTLEIARSIALPGSRWSIVRPLNQSTLVPLAKSTRRSSNAAAAILLAGALAVAVLAS